MAMINDLNKLQNIEFDLSNGIATVTLNRPEEANSINIALAQDLLEVAIACESSKDVRVVLLTGKGKLFCGGGDINSFAESGDEFSEMLIQLTSYLHAAIARFRHMRAPLVVAVGGAAAGAGLSLVAMGDYVVASEKAKFTMAYTGIGLSPDGSSSYFLPRLIGLRRTIELMMTNRVLSAAEAVEWGLVNQIVDPDQVFVKAAEMADLFSAGPTESYGAIKELMSVTYSNGLETQMDLESRLIANMGRTHDGQEGVDAFLNKRKPKFIGQ